MPTPPSLISFNENTATPFRQSGGTLTTLSISWQTNDVVVALGLNEGTDTLALATATGLTFVNQQSVVGTLSNCAARIDAVIAGSNGSSAVSMIDSGSLHCGLAVWVWRGSAGIGNSAQQATATESVSLTASGADSAIIWGVGDFSASALGTIVPTPTNTRERFADTGYSYYVADLTDQPLTSGVLYGESGSPGAGPYSIVVLEIKAAAATGTVFGSSFLLSGVGSN